MKILFVNTHLSTGGIATSLVNLCEKLKEFKDIEIDVVLLHGSKGDIRYKLPSNVNIITPNTKYLDLYASPFKEVLKSLNIIKITQVFTIKTISKLLKSEKFMKLVMSKYTKLEGYDVAISFRNDEYQQNPYAVCGCNDFVLQCVEANKKIAWIHNDPDRHGFTYDISKEKFKDFDTIVNVSKGCKDRFDEIIPEYKYKSELAYNTFNHDEIIEKGNISNPYPKTDKIKLVTVGRVSNEQKRMDRIIEVCKNMRNKDINNYIWYIVGDGPDLDGLKIKVKELNLTEQIVFVGKQSNPFIYMKNADCLVMTSEYEAFPMTLNESIILGTPIITTNNISAKEIIRGNINGFIAENSSEGIEGKVELILKDNKKLITIKDRMNKNQMDKEIAIKQFFSVIDYSANGVKDEN